MPENGKDVKSEAQDDKEKRDKTENNGGHAHSAKSPKKRRKVNHVPQVVRKHQLMSCALSACVYCRRSVSQIALTQTA
ncbi:transcriptional regulator [Colletotrichum nymphaeae SA-01]|uniref:Transcriptional regulator n=1 Tax=Colletotrichum nymphaeae SA-01 TaxID=1460502 RepID=A0A135RNI6_9PEZI|nr:transcriptional regulator [Colletotrichum nymphaeae SA-01]